MIDPNNPVVKLCSEGMASEAQGDVLLAMELYMQAWESCSNDYDACMVAHYVARHQETPEETLRWNLLALEKADKVGAERVAMFYPSLYLCVGKSYEDLGDLEGASKHYLEAKDRIDILPEGPYGDVVREGLKQALSRLRL